MFRLAQRLDRLRDALFTEVEDGVPPAGGGRGAEAVAQRGLLRLFVASQLETAFAMPVLAVIFAGSSLMWSRSLQPLVWLAGIFLCHAIQHALCRKCARADQERLKAAEWVGMLAASEFLYAVTWSAQLFLFWDSAGSVKHVYLIAMLIVVIAVRLVVSSYFMPVVLAGTATITAAIVVRCALDGAPLYYGLGVIAVTAELYFLQLAKALQGTARDMLIFKSERERLIEALAAEKVEAEAARRKAEEANYAKSRFLATMSHELRTPLNAILGFSEILKGEMFGKHAFPQYRDYSADIHVSGSYLLALINDILDLSRIEAGGYPLAEEPVSIAALGEACRHLLELKAQERGVAVLERFAAGLPAVLADERALRQIWINLLSNALKFTPPGGTIELRASRTPLGGVRFSVKDTGPGIPAQEIPVILSAFSQGSLAHRGAAEGAGLGLAIVQGLVKLHGGSLEVVSEVGRGTEVVVSLPARRVLTAADAAPQRTMRPSEGEQRLVSLTG